MSLISVIVPVYNVEEYVDKCIASLVAQSYYNLEILLIDDGSTDNSGYLCDQWANRDKRIKVIHSPNAGVSHARNLGLSIASGDYIGFVDADDWINADMYESMMNYLNEFHSDVHIGGFTVNYPDIEIRTLKKGMPHSMSPQLAMKEMLSLEKKPLFRGHLCDKLYKSTVLKNKRLDENLKLSEDTLFFWQILQDSTLVSYAPQFSYHYRMRGESATHRKMRKEDGTYLDAILKIKECSTNLDKSVQHATELFYLAQTVSVLKTILISHAVGFEKVFSRGQRDIRKGFFKCFRVFPRNAKIGLLFLSLPKCIVLLLAPILRIIKNR